MAGDDRFAGRTALVTGAGSGLGRGAALELAAGGARVICADIDEAAAAATAADAGAAAAARAVDVADEGSVGALAETLATELAAVDVLVHCAGIAGNGTAITTDRATWDRVLAINLTGTWLMARAVLPGMMRARRGSIVNVASVAGIIGVPDIASYAAAKGGVVALTRQMAVDFAPDGIRVNAICPGTVPTPLVVGAYAARGDLDPDRMDEGLARAARRYPLRRLGTVEDVARLAALLASDDAAWMTGAVIPLDGGLTAAAWQPGG
jgi:NAD(P)-dependent dehydrogenase (short-subunit alcohol dehydrogenase family)